MERGQRGPRGRIVVVAAMLSALAIGFLLAGFRPSDRAPERAASNGVMLILRGIASSERPHGQLDDQSALEYARRLHYQGEVLDVAGNGGADSPQVKMALARIRGDDKVTAIYGFSGGGYNARRIWARLNGSTRRRIHKIVVLGSPGVTKGDFPESTDVVIKEDPPTGHMAGPKVLLESLGRS
jgi:hypothetical protein